MFWHSCFVSSHEVTFITLAIYICVFKYCRDSDNNIASHSDANNCFSRCFVLLSIGCGTVFTFLFSESDLFLGLSLLIWFSDPFTVRHVHFYCFLVHIHFQLPHCHCQLLQYSRYFLLGNVDYFHLQNFQCKYQHQNWKIELLVNHHIFQIKYQNVLVWLFHCPILYQL